MGEAQDLGTGGIELDVQSIAGSQEVLWLVYESLLQGDDDE